MSLTISVKALIVKWLVRITEPERVAQHPPAIGDHAWNRNPLIGRLDRIGKPHNVFSSARIVDTSYSGRYYHLA